jgi:hypothetical protein
MELTRLEALTSQGLTVGIDVRRRRPAHLMDDGKHGIVNAGRNLFSDFSEVAERLGGES